MSRKCLVAASLSTDPARRRHEVDLIERVVLGFALH
jgi:hypothetical protein